MEEGLVLKGGLLWFCCFLLMFSRLTATLWCSRRRRNTVLSTDIKSKWQMIYIIYTVCKAKGSLMKGSLTLLAETHSILSGWE